MLDFSNIAEAVSGDPLVLVLVLFMAVGVATQGLLRRYPMARAVLRILFLIVLTIALVHAGLAPYRPLQSSGSPFRDAVHVLLQMAWWLWAAWFLVGLLRAIVVLERLPRETKLVQDLLAGFIYLAAVFAIIAYVFDLPIQGLLATSGAVAIILGLAMQSSLSDVFSGVVLSFSRPYAPGDWISLEGGTEGRVIEINWRATHILTARRDLAIVPNSTIGKAKIVNVSSPSGIHGVTITVPLAAMTSPAIGAEIIERALLNSRLILAAPAPLIATKSISADAIGYEITFFVEQLGDAPKAQNELFDMIFRHAAAAGVELASPQNEAGSVRPAEPARPKSAAEAVLDLVAIFADLPPPERSAIAGKLKTLTYAEGAKLAERGTVMKSLFIIGCGVVSFVRPEGDTEIELARLGPGEHYGEIGMLTGVAASATIRALTPVTLYELAKADLAPILEARPQVAHRLSRDLARRQAANRAPATAELGGAVPSQSVIDWFSERLRRLYDLANSA
jgi:small-conductance mechanosensitive channel/CRP-like cAMP-binding protein